MNSSRRTFMCFAFASLLHCSAPGAAVDSGSEESGADADAGLGQSDGGEHDAGADAGSSVTVLTDLVLPGSPHLIDVFLPSNAQRVVVFLHGGGGSKEGAESREIVIRRDNPPAATPVPDSEFLLASHTAFVVPQGQSLGKAATWTNYVMTSGVDDVAFLRALAMALRGGTLDSRVRAFSRVYLSGHSNGGMMANRMWCEAPTTFDAYGSLAGPASIQLTPPSLSLAGGQDDPLTGAHPCTPSLTKPYLGIIGEEDTVLQTKSRWPEDIWAINACLTAGGAGGFVDPNLVSEQRFHDFRARTMCLQAAGSPVASTDGSTLSWSACDGGVRLDAIVHADHCVIDSMLPCINGKILPSSCANSLETVSGRRMREVLVEFFSATE